MERIEILEQGSVGFIDVPSYSCCFTSISIIR